MTYKVGEPVEEGSGRFHIPIIRENSKGLVTSNVVARVASNAFETLKEATTFAAMLIFGYTRVSTPPGETALLINLQQVDDFNWASQAYGDVMMEKRYQALRFMEEASELVQVLGLTPEDIAMVVRDVYANPPGKLDIEIGDVQITTNILAMTQFRSVAECRVKCLEKLALRTPEELRAKDQAKMARGLI